MRSHETGDVGDAAAGHYKILFQDHLRSPISVRAAQALCFHRLTQMSSSPSLHRGEGQGNPMPCAALASSHNMLAKMH